MKKVGDKKVDKILRGLRVEPGKKFRLSRRDPADTGGFAREQPRQGAAPCRRRAARRAAGASSTPRTAGRVLLIFQAMDAAGKDGTIKHVMSRRQPAGLPGRSASRSRRPRSSTTTSSGATMKCLPERGRIGIFNRSYYEDVLVVQVHPEFLGGAAAAARAASARTFWEERYEDINAFERHLVAQRHRDPQVLPARLEGGAEAAVPRAARRARRRTGSSRSPTSTERGHWDDYMTAYEDMLGRTSTSDGRRGTSSRPTQVVHAPGRRATIVERCRI